MIKTASEELQIYEIESRIVEINGVPAILDRDVASLYGVETKRVNEAVKNNPEKFPEGYVLEVSDEMLANSLRSNDSTLELESLRSKVSTLDTPGHGRGKHSKYRPKAFTERGLYMLATVLKSSRATQTTISIIETFTKVRELARNVQQLHHHQNLPQKQPQKDRKALIQASGEVLSELLDPRLDVSDSETSIEINFAVLKFKHTVKRKFPKN